MDRHRFFEIRDGHVLDRANADDARIVDEHIESPGSFERLRNQALGVGSDTDVADDCRGVDALCLQVAACAVQLFLVPRADYKPRPLLAKFAREHEPQTARPSGNHDGPAIKVDAT